MSCCNGYCCNAAQLSSPESKLPLVIQINPDIDTALFIYYRKDSLNEGSTFFKLSIIIPTEAAQGGTNFNLITNKMPLSNSSGLPLIFQTKIQGYSSLYSSNFIIFQGLMKKIKVLFHLKFSLSK